MKMVQSRTCTINRYSPEVNFTFSSWNILQSPRGSALSLKAVRSCVRGHFTNWLQIKTDGTTPSTVLLPSFQTACDQDMIWINYKVHKDESLNDVQHQNVARATFCTCITTICILILQTRCRNTNALILKAYHMYQQEAECFYILCM